MFSLIGMIVWLIITMLSKTAVVDDNTFWIVWALLLLSGVLEKGLAGIVRCLEDDEDADN